MLKSLLLRVASNGHAYDLIQALLGAKRVHRWLARCFAMHLKEKGIVLDIGAGTGALRPLCPENVSYIAVDNDIHKVARLISKEPTAHAVIGSGAVIPILSSSADAVVCSALTHHLADDEMGAFLAEVNRVLTPSGTFILMDAVWERSRLLSRLLWYYDAGSWPRTADRLRSLIQQRFSVCSSEMLSANHRYIAFVARQPSHPAI